MAVGNRESQVAENEAKLQQFIQETLDKTCQKYQDRRGKIFSASQDRMVKIFSAYQDRLDKIFSASQQNCEEIQDKLQNLFTEAGNLPVNGGAAGIDTIEFEGFHQPTEKVEVEGGGNNQENQEKIKNKEEACDRKIIQENKKDVEGMLEKNVGNFFSPGEARYWVAENVFVKKLEK
jgi:hypothetical protein